MVALASAVAPGLLATPAKALREALLKQVVVAEGTARPSSRRPIGSRGRWPSNIAPRWRRPFARERTARGALRARACPAADGVQAQPHGRALPSTSCDLPYGLSRLLTGPPHQNSGL